MAEAVMDEAEGLVEDEVAEEGGSKGLSLPMLIVLLLVGVGAGGWYGAPLLAPTLASATAGLGSGGGGHGGGGHGDDGHGGEAPAAEPYTIENLVLNPAGSGGSRFLLATLVVEADEDTKDELEARDAEARDVLLILLSALTTDELSQVSKRGEIRDSIKSRLNGMLGHEGVSRIFLPQFVIQ